MRRVVLAIMVFGLASAASADMLWDQPWDGSSTAVAQEFPDFPDYSTWEFDDIVVPGPGWLIDSVYIPGSESGNSGANQDVLLAFATDHDYNTIFATFSGTQVGQDLQFDLGGYNLPAGNYWVTAWVLRSFGDGGQWFWGRNGSVANGDEEWFHNPGGGFGFGGAPVPGSVVFGAPGDQAFTIEGTVVPEPATLSLLALAGFTLLRRR